MGPGNEQRGRTYKSRERHFGIESTLRPVALWSWSAVSVLAIGAGVYGSMYLFVPDPSIPRVLGFVMVLLTVVCTASFGLACIALEWHYRDVKRHRVLMETIEEERRFRNRPNDGWRPAPRTEALVYTRFDMERIVG